METNKTVTKAETKSLAAFNKVQAARRALKAAYDSLVKAHKGLQRDTGTAIEMADGDVRSICGLLPPPRPSFTDVEAARAFAGMEARIPAAAQPPIDSMPTSPTKARTKAIDTAQGASGEDACIACGRAFKAGQQHRSIHLVHGGGEVVHPEDEAIYEQEGDRGDMHYFPIGMDCARKLGLEWTHPAVPSQA